MHIVSGPSGVGKGAVLEKVLARDPSLRLSVSYTTRPKKDGEVDGKHYFFTTRENFEVLWAGGYFLEYSEYCGELYGTPKSVLNLNSSLVLEIDCEGARTLKRKFPHAAHSTFLLPPSYDELERRVRMRNREKSEAEIERRLRKGVEEVHRAEEFDFWIVNDDLESAAHELFRLVKLLRAGRQSEPETYRNTEVLADIRANFILV